MGRSNNTSIFLRALALLALCAVPLSARENTPLLGGGVFEILQQGGVVMVVILFGSIVGLALAFERMVSLTPSRLSPSAVRRALEAAAETGHFDEATGVAEQSKSPLGRIATAGLRRLAHGPLEMEKMMEAVAQIEVARLKRPVRPIAILATVMPLLGLLGTIIGMISTFNQLDGGAVTDRVKTLAPGIGQALYTTAAGLCVSIPFVLAFHYLTGRINQAVGQWNLLGTGLVLAAGRANSSSATSATQKASETRPVPPIEKKAEAVAEGAA